MSFGGVQAREARGQLLSSSPAMPAHPTTALDPAQACPPTYPPTNPPTWLPTHPPTQSVSTGVLWLDRCNALERQKESHTHLLHVPGEALLRRKLLEVLKVAFGSVDRRAAQLLQQLLRRLKGGHLHEGRESKSLA